MSSQIYRLNNTYLREGTAAAARIIMKYIRHNWNGKGLVTDVSSKSFQIVTYRSGSQEHVLEDGHNGQVKYNPLPSTHPRSNDGPTII